ncbi:MAG: xylitol oxidase [Saprospiraceae bacterium]
MEVQGTFELRQDVFLNLLLASLEANFDKIMSGGYGLSLFTDWMDNYVVEVWIKRRMDGHVADLGNDFFTAKPATKKIYSIVGFSAENCSN